MDKIEEKIIKIIDDNKEKLIAFARDIYTDNNEYDAWDTTDW